MYVYTKAGFEQDIVLQEQAPSPESVGLNPATTRLQVWTEFFDPPQPRETLSTLPEQAGLVLTDDTLDFGSMRMAPGSAFKLGANSLAAKVAKSWVTFDGRQFLVETVPLAALAEQFGNLPKSAKQVSSTFNARVNSKHRVLPPQHLARNEVKHLRFSKRKTPERGLALDYLALNSGLTNYTFEANRTYFISGAVNLFDTNAFEGGTVIKYTNSATSEISVNGGVDCETESYKMAIFTSMDDNSVGSEISSSSGMPSNGQATYLNINTDGINYLQYLRFAYAGTAIEANDENIWNSQFVHCNNGLMVLDNVSLYNTLFSRCNDAIDLIYPSGVIVAENITADGTFLEGVAGEVDVTNCIIVDGVSAGSLHSNNNFQEYNLNTPGFKQLSPFPPFQTVCAGSYYLQNGGNCRGGGTTNINPSLLSEMAQKTTYPPMIYSNVTFYTPTTLEPQVQRDNTGILDAGYHYDPLDYFVDGFNITNALLTVNAGTVIAFDNSLDCIWLQDNSSISSVGTALSPNWFVHYACSQEQPILIGTNGSSGFYNGLVIQTYTYTNRVQGSIFGFNKFAIPAGGSGYYFYDTSSWTSQNLVLENCELLNNNNRFDGSLSGISANTSIQNDLFNSSTITSEAGTSTNFSLSVSNCLFYNTTIKLLSTSSSNIWYFFNNDFDTTVFTEGQSTMVTNGYNAYLDCTGQLNPSNSTDIFGSNSLVYQTSFYGAFYQPTNSPLMHRGSTTANLAGLYHFTVSTNQVPETNSVLSIGYHYVAATPNGDPLDNNGDGIPDYIEDALGNGLDNSGEIGWNIPGDIGLTIMISQPQNGSTIP